MTYDKHECDLMCEWLAAYLEGDLAPAEMAEAERHLAECPSCREVLAELRAITSEAATMPLLTPSRDLWSGIDARISTPVTSLGSAPDAARRTPRRQWKLALAAAALIAVTAGTTYLITAHNASVTPSTVVATHTLAPARDTVTPAPAPTTRVAPLPVPPATARLASRTRKELSAVQVYDHEIALLDGLVRTRHESLDPKTVAVISQNLKIIDKAIAESRAALANDPRSSLLSSQLDNVLGSKVELLRTIALLPSQS